MSVEKAGMKYGWESKQFRQAAFKELRFLESLRPKEK